MNKADEQLLLRTQEKRGEEAESMDHSNITSAFFDSAEGFNSVSDETEQLEKAKHEAASNTVWQLRFVIRCFKEGQSLLCDDVIDYLLEEYISVTNMEILPYLRCILFSQEYLLQTKKSFMEIGEALKSNSERKLTESDPLCLDFLAHYSLIDDSFKQEFDSCLNKVLQIRLRQESYYEVCNLAFICQEFEDKQQEIITYLKNNELTKLVMNENHFEELLPLFTEYLIIIKKCSNMDKILENYMYSGRRAIIELARVCCSLSYNQNLFDSKMNEEAGPINEQYINAIVSMTLQYLNQKTFPQKIYSICNDNGVFFNKYEFLNTYSSKENMYYDCLIFSYYSHTGSHVAKEHIFFLAQLFQCHVSYYRKEGSCFVNTLFLLKEISIQNNDELQKIIKGNVEYYLNCVCRKEYYEEYLINLENYANEFLLSTLRISKYQLYSNFNNMMAWLNVRESSIDQILMVHQRYACIALIDEKMDLFNAILGHILELLKENVVFGRCVPLEYILICGFLEYDIKNNTICEIQQCIRQYLELLSNVDIREELEYLEHFESQEQLVHYLFEHNEEQLISFIAEYLNSCVADKLANRNIILFEMIINKARFSQKLIESYSQIIESNEFKNKLPELERIVFNTAELFGIEDTICELTPLAESVLINDCCSKSYSNTLLVYYNLNNDVVKEGSIVSDVFSELLLYSMQEHFVNSYYITSTNILTLQEEIAVFMRQDALYICYFLLEETEKKKNALLFLTYAYPILRFLNLFAQNIIIEMFKPESNGFCESEAEVLRQICFSELCRYCYSSNFIEFSLTCLNLNIENEKQVLFLQVMQTHICRYYQLQAILSLEQLKHEQMLEALERSREYRTHSYESEQLILSYYDRNINLESAIFQDYIEECLEFNESLQQFLPQIAVLFELEDEDLSNYVLSQLLELTDCHFSNCDVPIECSKLLNNDTECQVVIEYRLLRELAKENNNIYNFQYLDYEIYESELYETSNILFIGQNNDDNNYYYICSLELISILSDCESSVPVLQEKIIEMYNTIFENKEATKENQLVLLYPGVEHLVNLLIKANIISTENIQRFYEKSSSIRKQFFDTEFSLSGIIISVLPQESNDARQENKSSFINVNFISELSFVEYLQILDELGKQKEADVAEEIFFSVNEQTIEYCVMLYACNGNFRRLLPKESTFESKYSSLFEYYWDFCSLNNEEVFEFGQKDKALIVFTDLQLSLIEEVIESFADQDINYTVTELLKFIIYEDSEEYLEGNEYLEGVAVRYILVNVLGKTGIDSLECKVLFKLIVAIVQMGNIWNFYENYGENTDYLLFCEQELKYEQLSVIFHDRIRNNEELATKIISHLCSEKSADLAIFLFTYLERFRINFNLENSWIAASAFEKEKLHDEKDYLPAIPDNEQYHVEMSNMEELLNLIYLLLSREKLNFRADQYKKISALIFDCNTRVIGIYEELSLKECQNVIDEVERITLLWLIHESVAQESVELSQSLLKLLLEHKKESEYCGKILLVILEYYDCQEEQDFLYSAYNPCFEGSISELLLVNYFLTEEQCQKDVEIIIEEYEKLNTISTDKSVCAMYMLECELEYYEEWINKLVTENCKDKERVSEEPMQEVSRCVFRMNQYLDIDIDLIREEYQIENEKNMIFIIEFHLSEIELQLLFISNYLMIFVLQEMQFENVLAVEYELSKIDPDKYQDIEPLIAKIICEYHIESDLLEGQIFDLEYLIKLFKLQSDENSIRECLNLLAYEKLEITTGIMLLYMLTEYQTNSNIEPDKKLTFEPIKRMKNGCLKAKLLIISQLLQ